jgi:hypothetical protein
MVDLGTKGSKIMLNKKFTAKLQKSHKKGGWPYVIWADSVNFCVRVLPRGDKFTHGLAGDKFTQRLKGIRLQQELQPIFHIA